MNPGITRGLVYTDTRMEQVLEVALATHERELARVVKAGKDLERALIAWQKAVSEGRLADMDKLRSNAEVLYSALAEPLSEAAVAWSFDLKSYLGSDSWLDELQSSVRSDPAGVRVFPGLNELICPPLVIRPNPTQGTLRIGKLTWKRLRPSAVVAELKRLTGRGSARQDQAFLEQLYETATFLSRGKPTGNKLTVKLRDIYDLWKLAPGWKKENPELTFTQALYSLHESNIRVTKGGKKYELEGPTGTPKAAEVLSVTAKDGRPIYYYMIHFL